MSRDFSSRRALHSSSDSSNTLVSVSLTHSSLSSLAPSPLQKPSIRVYTIHIHVHCLCTRPFEGGRSGDRFQVSSLAAERGTKRGARGGGGRRRRRGARNRLSNLEPSLDLNEIVSYVTAEWLALRSYVRGKRAITRLSFGRRFLIPPALTLISR